MAMLVELTGARQCLEIGTFTGYSSTAVALALPPDGHLLCCDVSEAWTAIARRYWREAGVDDRVELRLGPGLTTLDDLLSSGREGSYDFAFVDADKEGYDGYYERLLRLLRPGGLVAFDNVLWGGEVLAPADNDPAGQAVAALNEKLRTDERVSLAMLPIADGVTLARKR
jgi:caffeoyl-CoA O-methyltransferase